MKHPTTSRQILARSATALSVLAVLPFTILIAAEETKKVKVYILAGQSNMVGIGQVTGSDARWGKEFSDTVLSVYEGNPEAATDYDKLKPVKTIPLAEIGGVNPEPFPKEGVAVLRGQLTMPATGVYEFRPGYGASEENIMVVNGTEIYRKEPGGKATQTAIKLEAGKQYDDCFSAAKEVLAKFDEKYPQWKGRGYEIAGFGWWQGHKDGGEQGKDPAGVHAQRYEQNLAHLIKTLRKEFNAPNAPFVVATCGFNGGEGWEPGSSAETIFNAQMNISDPAKHPDLAGNVKSVDTRPFYRKPEVSPRNQSFHYHGNAETYMLVGEAMGKAMVELGK